jgi:hypothetical protein
MSGDFRFSVSPIKVPNLKQFSLVTTFSIMAWNSPRFFGLSGVSVMRQVPDPRYHWHRCLNLTPMTRCHWWHCYPIDIKTTTKSFAWAQISECQTRALPPVLYNKCGGLTPCKTRGLASWDVGTGYLKTSPLTCSPPSESKMLMRGFWDLSSSMSSSVPSK